MLRYLQRYMEQNPAIPPFEREYYKRLNAKVFPPVLDFTGDNWSIPQEPTSGSHYVREREMGGNVLTGDPLLIRYDPPSAFIAADESFKVTFHFNAAYIDPTGGGAGITIMLSGSLFDDWYMVYLTHSPPTGGHDFWFEVHADGGAYLDTWPEGVVKADHATDYFGELVVDKSIGVNGRATLNLYNRWLALVGTQYIDMDGDFLIDQLDITIIADPTAGDRTEAKVGHMYIEIL